MFCEDLHLCSIQDHLIRAIADQLWNSKVWRDARQILMVALVAALHSLAVVAICQNCLLYISAASHGACRLRFDLQPWEYDVFLLRFVLFVR